jgi:hypothetical protein
VQCVAKWMWFVCLFILKLFVNFEKILIHLIISLKCPFLLAQSFQGERKEGDFLKPCGFWTSNLQERSQPYPLLYLVYTMCLS